MAAKLLQRRYDEAEAEVALERLERQGLIDDGRTAREFVRGRMARRPTGRRRLAAELSVRGVDSETVRRILDELYPEDDLEIARDAGRRWRPAGRGSAALARYLERRGFSSRAIFSVIRETGDDSDASEDPPFQ